MEQAKSAIKDLTSGHGHHSTTVHEHSKPAVTHEHVTKTRHDEGQTVVDKEMHQEHYHTSVQPIHHQEVLPERHEHKLLPTEEKEFHHGASHDTKERLATEAAKYKHATEVGDTKFTRSTQPEVSGEHVHHHIHETIQPVIQKETIDPTVVHTTKPVHEVHHNMPQHHATSVLPAVNLADFKGHGGSLEGAKDRVTHFEGEPGEQTIGGGTHHTGTHHTGTHHTGTHHTGTHAGGVTGATDQGVAGTSGRALNVGSTADTLGSSKSGSIMDRERPVAGHHGTEAATAGAFASNANEHRTENRMDPRVDSRREHVGREGGAAPIENRSHHPQTKHEPPQQKFADTHLGAGEGGNTTRSSNFEAANIRHEEHAQGKAKPSLLDKLNPMKDADGDGKKGIMK